MNNTNEDNHVQNDEVDKKIVPSEKIREIYLQKIKNKKPKTEIDAVQDAIYSILDFLDSEYNAEKKKNLATEDKIKTMLDKISSVM